MLYSLRVPNAHDDDGGGDDGVPFLSESDLA